MLRERLNINRYEPQPLFKFQSDYPHISWRISVSDHVGRHTRREEGKATVVCRELLLVNMEDAPNLRDGSLKRQRLGSRIPDSGQPLLRRELIGRTVEAESCEEYAGVEEHTAPGEFELGASARPA